MPIGVILNVLSVLLGGFLGSIAGNRLPERLKQGMTTIFGFCAMSIGISSIVLMKNLAAVIFSVIAGSFIGILLNIDGGIRAGTARLLNRLHFDTGMDEPLMVTAIVLFCASSTGIYGSLISGITGDHSILIAKSILDFFTAMVFASMIGPAVSAVAVPQLVVFLSLFYLSRIIYPMTTPTMIDDFRACGGFIMIATGFRILKLGEFPTADMIPAMILVMPLSRIWSTWVLPLIS